MRLIDADEIENKAVPMDSYDGFWSGTAVKLSVIRKSPTIDAVPVVRCRECKHWKPSGSKAGNSFPDMEYIGGCEFTKYCRRESDFCSYGERKEGKA